jgi:hypothetical protein
MLVVRHAVVEHDDDVNVTTNRGPQPIHCAACPTDCNFTIQELWVIFFASIVEGILDAVDDGVSDPEVMVPDELLVVALLDDGLDARQELPAVL